MYTLDDRHRLFRALELQIQALICQLRRGGAPGLSWELLTELVYAGLNAPGFSEPHRAELAATANSVGIPVRLSPLAAFWPFEVLGRKKGVEEDVVEVSIIVSSGPSRGCAGQRLFHPIVPHFNPMPCFALERPPEVLRRAIMTLQANSSLVLRCAAT